MQEAIEVLISGFTCSCKEKEKKTNKSVQQYTRTLEKYIKQRSHTQNLREREAFNLHELVKF